MKSFKIQIMATVMVGLFIAANGWSSDIEKNALSLKETQTHRSWVMKALAGHFIAISGESWYLTNQDMNIHYSEDTQFHADAIVGLSKIIPKTFPKGSGDGSRASPDIWRNSLGFEEEMEKIQQAAGKLAKAASEKDKEALEKAMLDVYATCRSCHVSFRKSP